MQRRICSVSGRYCRVQAAYGRSSFTVPKAGEPGENSIVAHQPCRKSDMGSGGLARQSPTGR